MYFSRLLACWLLVTSGFMPCILKAEDASQPCASPSSGPASGNAITAVNTVPSAQSIDIKIAAQSPLTVKTEKLILPDRIAFDFEGAQMTVPQNRIAVNSSGISGLRLSQYRTDPPVARVVVDLSEPHLFRVFRCQDGAVLRIFTNSSVAATPAPRLNGVITARLHERARPATPHPAAATTPQASPPAPTKDQHPSRTEIRYDNGLLTIQVENVSLASVIAGVGRVLKANVEIPPGSGLEMIVSNIGPVPPRDALEALLNGSSLNYILVEGPQPDRRMTIVLTRRLMEGEQPPVVAGASPTISEPPPEENMQPLDDNTIPEQAAADQPERDPAVYHPPRPPGREIQEPTPNTEDRMPPP
jgi:hypothetical protein